MIKTFADKQTEAFWRTGKSKKNPPSGLRKIVKRKLSMVDAAIVLDDLRIPPGNNLHALEQDRSGRHAISINDQFRVCFTWKDGHAYDVEVIDYHS